MSRLFGIVSENNSFFKNIIPSMFSSFSSRNFDENNTVFFENAFLGNARKTTIDLFSGKLPMKSPFSDSAITFDGRIYDSIKIRKTIDDFDFSDNSDSQTILALYEKYGIDMIQKLTGMFSFAIWDNKNKRLFAARDRYGQKPFYYAFGNNGEFIFASEIKTIIASNLITPVIDYDSMGHYLKYSYVHPNRTIYKNIYSLPLASFLCFENNNLKVVKYWDLPEIDDSITEEESIEKFGYLFNESMKKHTSDDLSLGIFLSGGLDSSAVVAEASRHLSHLKTFSFGFHNSERSELPFAKKVAEKFNSEHFEITDEYCNIPNTLIEMQKNIDEPFADKAFLPVYFLAKEAAKNCNIAIIGDGPDFLLSGFGGRYKGLETLYETKKSYICRLIKLFKTLINPKKDFKTPAKIAYLANRISLTKLHYIRKAHFSNNHLKGYGLQITDKIDEEFVNFNSGNFNDVHRLDLTAFFPGSVMKKNELSIAMAGIERYSPYLDDELAEFCMKIPDKYKFDTICGKKPLLKNFASMYPPEILSHKKQGFDMPANNLLYNPSLTDLKNEYLCNSSKKIFDILNYKEIHKTINVNTYTDYINYIRVWDFLILSLWLEEHS